MDIQPLNGILNGIGSGGEWDQQRQLQRLIGQWEAIVGSTVAQHSCPLEVRNGILQVATSTAVWAQNLSFERRRILKKLNQRAHFKILGLKEIRFSTAHWHNRPGSSGAIQTDKRLNSYQQQVQWQQHPSRLPPLKNERPEPEQAESASQAFDRWSQRRQQQVNQVPPCPQCQTPTPEGELQRWGICAFCMTQQWQAEKDANQPDGSEEAESWAKGAPSSRTVEEARLAKAAETVLAADETDEQSPEIRQHQVEDIQNPAKAAFHPQQKSHATKSSRPESSRRAGANLSQTPLKPAQSSSSPLQQLQHRAGLPPVAWPSPANSKPAEAQAKSSTQALSSPIAKPKRAIDSATGEAMDSPRKDRRSSVFPTQPTAPHQNRDGGAASSVGVSQDPALSGPLAPLSLDEQSQLGHLSSSEQASAWPAPTNKQSPKEQQQAAWAQAFQDLKSQEMERQLRQAEFERRTAERILQVRGDRAASLPQSSNSHNGATTGCDGTAAKPGAKESLNTTEKLTSGRSKPVLKKKRHIPPQG